MGSQGTEWAECGHGGNGGNEGNMGDGSGNVTVSVGIRGMWAIRVGM